MREKIKKSDMSNMVSKIKGIYVITQSNVLNFTHIRFNIYTIRLLVIIDKSKT